MCVKYASLHTLFFLLFKYHFDNVDYLRFEAICYVSIMLVQKEYILKRAEHTHFET